MIHVINNKNNLVELRLSNCNRLIMRKRVVGTDGIHPADDMVNYSHVLALVGCIVPSSQQNHFPLESGEEDMSYLTQSYWT